MSARDERFVGHWLSDVDTGKAGRFRNPKMRENWRSETKEMITLKLWRDPHQERRLIFSSKRTFLISRKNRLVRGRTLEFSQAGGTPGSLETLD